MFQTKSTYGFSYSGTQYHSVSWYTQSIMLSVSSHSISSGSETGKPASMMDWAYGTKLNWWPKATARGGSGWVGGAAANCGGGVAGAGENPTKEVPELRLTPWGGAVDAMLWC